jgi:hypothetical protein
LPKGIAGDEQFDGGLGFGGGGDGVVDCKAEAFELVREAGGVGALGVEAEGFFAGADGEDGVGD